MSRSIIIGFFLGAYLLSSSLLAQGDARFLYIQSEPVRRFELVYAGVVKGASSMGYLILPGLPTGVVEFILRTEEDRTYRVDLTEGDKGLGLQKKSEGWILVDLKSGQTVESVILGATGSSGDHSDASPFARLLSKAVQDPTLLSNRRFNKSVVDFAGHNETNVKDSALPVGMKSLATTVKTHSDTIRLDTTVRPVLATPRSDLVRLLSSVEHQGVWEATYLVREADQLDTIRVELVGGKRMSDTVVQEGSVSLPLGCVAELMESEFLQLRTRMAAALDEDEMVLMIRRVVRTHCLSVSQIRRLSNIFLYDETRYRFYDAVYGHVTDPVHFSELATYLSDPAYQRRFRALLER